MNARLPTFRTERGDLMNYGVKEICRDCKFARDKYGGSCYCVKYGIVIGYSKRNCVGYERNEVQKPKDNH